MIFLQPLKKYIDFWGRASRMELWSYMVFLISLGLGVCMIDIATGNFNPETGEGHWINIYSLLTVLPTLGVSVRRLHDINWSGWWWLVSLTGIGAIFLVVLYGLKGTDGENRFGPKPIR